MTEARMQETPNYAPGTFCWVELGTTDSESAKKFYTELFGWTFENKPAGPGMIYTMLFLDGKDTGALYELDEAKRKQGIPPHWMSYAAVASADESAKKAKELGATIIVDPFDVMTVGRMAVVQDPTGAVFSLWEGRDHKGAGVVNVPNSFCWNELMTTDTAKEGDFYTGLFGWTKNAQNFGPLEYTMFANNDRPAGGMLQITPEMGPIPPNWLVYFAVADCDAATQKATTLGGKVMKAPDDIPGVGRFSIMFDPQGATFALIKLDTPQT